MLAAACALMIWRIERKGQSKEKTARQVVQIMKDLGLRPSGGTKSQPWKALLNWKYKLLRGEKGKFASETYDDLIIMTLQEDRETNGESGDAGLVRVLRGFAGIEDKPGSPVPLSDHN